MSSYITNTRPSVFQRILHSFGLIELPIKVNCWYCCQDSFILPGSKNTVDHWYCHLCESVNARDKNGEVVDPTPFETYKPPSENNAHTSSRLKSLKTLKNSNRSLCNSCQENQSLIYQLLSDYIPDESDPSYDFKCKNVYQYKADLHRRYRLCNDCQAKITQLVEEQKAALQARNMSDAITKSMTTEARKRPNKYRFYTKGICWSLIHAITVLFVIYCILHPSAFRLRSLPMGNDYYELLIFRKNSILSKLHSSTSLISNLHQCLKITPRLFFDFLQNSVVCLLKYDDELCSVSSPAWVETAIVSNFLTYGWMEWHANQRKVFNDNQRLTHWELYRKCQFGLWCLRIILIGCIIFNVGTYILISLLVIYVLILTIPYFLVKPSKGKWPLSLVGVSHSSFMLEDEEDDRVKGSSSLPVKLRRGGVNNHRHDSEENFENDDPMMADDMSIVQEEPSIIQQQQQQTPYFHFRQQDSDILDNIVSGFNNIKMQ